MTGVIVDLILVAVIAWLLITVLHVLRGCQGGWGYPAAGARHGYRPRGPRLDACNPPRGGSGVLRR